MRIAIVNDVGMIAEALRRIVTAEPEYDVAWIARDGAEAVKMCAADRPDLILMDIIMPVMDGVRATRAIMAGTPCPILILTASVTENAAMVFEAMSAGALDAISTPVLDPGKEKTSCAELLKKIRTIDRLRKAEKRAHSLQFTAVPMKRASDKWIVVLGASTGGPGALAKILSALPPGFPASVVVVQHLDKMFTAGLVEWLNHYSTLPVRIAREGEKLVPGTVFIAGTNDHLYFRDDGCLGYTQEPVSIPYRPSVDVFFDSVLKHWSGGSIAVLLTGMGRDGADGLLRLKEHGTYTVAQNAETCKVYGMPKAAIEQKAAVDVLPVESIAEAVMRRILIDKKDARRA